MTKIYKGNMANLASMLLNADQQLGDNTGTEELSEMLEKKYGIDFDGFCSRMGYHGLCAIIELHGYRQAGTRFGKLYRFIDRQGIIPCYRIQGSITLNRDRTP